MSQQFLETEQLQFRTRKTSATSNMSPKFILFFIIIIVLTPAVVLTSEK